MVSKLSIFISLWIVINRSILNNGVYSFLEQIFLRNRIPKMILQSDEKQEIRTLKLMKLNLSGNYINYKMNKVQIWSLNSRCCWFSWI
jgi:hypothetical protein